MNAANRRKLGATAAAATTPVPEATTPAKRVRGGAKPEVSAAEPVSTEIKSSDVPEEAGAPIIETPEDEKPAEEPEKVIVVDEIPANACEVYGSNDPNSKICKKCFVKFPECFARCVTKTTEGAKKKRDSGEQKERKERTPRVAGTGEFTLFGHCKTNSQAGLIEQALEAPKTIAEIETVTGCTTSRIKSHINWLVKLHSANCTKVMADGKIHFTVNAPPTLAATAPAS